MGICASKEEQSQRAVNDMIEKEMRVDQRLHQSDIKMLLLGTAESGKSTILKQMRLLHDSGYTEQEKLFLKEVLYENIMQCISTTLVAMDTLGIELMDSNLDAHKQLIQSISYERGPEFPSELSNAIEALWRDEGVRKCIDRANEYQLPVSAQYFFDDIKRLSNPKVELTDQDILRIRIKTTGVFESRFLVKDKTYRMFDVGGQRSERKKWIHSFEGVTAVIFLAAISEYDQVLGENLTTNRIQEALDLFYAVCNSKFFKETSMILFLNKKDLFEIKLKHAPLDKCFPDYNGGSNYTAACDYLLNKFTSLNQTPTKQVYCHFTCATDSNQISKVMDAVDDIIVLMNLQSTGMIG